MIIGLIAQLWLQLDFWSFAHGYIPAVRTLIYSTIFFLGVHLFIKRDCLFDISFIIIAGSLFIFGIYAAIQFLAISTSLFAIDNLPYIATYERTDGTEYIVDHAPTGFGTHAFVLANYGLLLFVIGTSILVSNFYHRLVGVLSVLMGMLMIFISYRRAQIGTLVVLMILYVAITPIDIRKKAIIGGTSITGVLAPFVFIDEVREINQELGHRLESMMDLITGTDSGSTGLEGRVDGTWDAFLTLFLEYPLGYGLYPPNVLGMGSDSAYLTYLAWGNIVGLLLFLLFLWYPLYLTVTKLTKLDYLNSRQVFIVFATFGILCSMTMTSIFGGSVMSSTTNFGIWLIMAGLISIVYRDPGSNQ
ncbi:hypothetical protein [Natranaeroarchaeum sulfidigenes]|nr:hypothetical protein [Natranaeroarchaeum sulfidigenes]